MAQVEDAVNRAADRDHEGGEPSSRQIQADIDRTRSNMDRTFDAIESKLTPGQLLQEAWGIFKGGSGAGASKALQIAKEHPLPAAVIGLGFGWLLLDSSRGTRSSRRGNGRSYAYDERYRYSQYGRSGQGFTGDLDYPGTRDAWREDWEEGESRLGAAKDAVKSAAGSAADLASNAKEKVSDLASQAGDKLGDLTDKVKEQASGLTDRVKEQASELGRGVQEGSRKARLGFWQLLEERPLVVGAATLALGLLAGLSIPSTDVEDELMGETRDQLLDTAKETGRDVLEKGKTVAGAAVDAVQRAAEENDLSVDKLADKVKAVANEAKEAVKIEAQKQNLTPEALAGNPPQGQPQNAGGPGQPQPNQPPQQPGRPAEAKPQEVLEPELAKR
jgi:gas vesicle protein